MCGALLFLGEVQKLNTHRLGYIWKASVKLKAVFSELWVTLCNKHTHITLPIEMMMEYFIPVSIYCEHRRITTKRCRTCGYISPFFLRAVQWLFFCIVIICNQISFMNLSLLFKKGYVNLVSLVAHFQIAIDAVLVDVRYGCHVRYAFVRRWSQTTCNLENFKLVIGHK